LSLVLPFPYSPIQSSSLFKSVVILNVVKDPRISSLPLPLPFVVAFASAFVLLAVLSLLPKQAHVILSEVAHGTL
jgi:hypothetical protein